MKKLALFALLTLTTALSFAAPCTHSVKVEILPVTYSVSSGKKAADLAGVPGSVYVPGAKVLGIATSLGSVSPLDLSNGDCKNVILRVGFKPVEVYIASELSPDECSYNHVLQHELEHVKMYETFLAENESKFKQLVSGNLDDNDKIIEAMKGMVKILDGIYAYQKKLDSDEEYDKNRWVCGGAIVKLMRGV